LFAWTEIEATATNTAWAFTGNTPAESPVFIIGIVLPNDIDSSGIFV